MGLKLTGDLAYFVTPFGHREDKKISTAQLDALATSSVTSFLEKENSFDSLCSDPLKYAIFKPELPVRMPRFPERETQRLNNELNINKKDY
uniref:Uncharacterized protein n=1 Tax=Araneus ventricosus TaxID=182803 RepID=A0A4Y2NES2_ARAVE|nr:hypothetical protein AVEN_7540-1 [Araneus ventricosus]